MFKCYPGVFDRPMFNYLSEYKLSGEDFKYNHLKGMLKYREWVVNNINLMKELPLRKARRMFDEQKSERDKVSL